MFKKVIFGLLALGLLFGSSYAGFHQPTQQSAATTTTSPTIPGDGGIGD